MKWIEGRELCGPLGLWEVGQRSCFSSRREAWRYFDCSLSVRTALKKSKNAPVRVGVTRLRTNAPLDPSPQPLRVGRCSGVLQIVRFAFGVEIAKLHRRLGAKLFHQLAPPELYRPQG